MVKRKYRQRKFEEMVRRGMIMSKELEMLTSKLEEPRTPDEVETMLELEKCADKMREQEHTINALLYSLSKTNVDRIENDNLMRKFQEKYIAEDKRANKLFKTCEELVAILEELKHHIELKEATINRDGKEFEIAWVKSQGFVVKGTKPYEILKKWLDEDETK